MKILLDHNTPHQLRRILAEHEVHTAAYMGWSELENGELLSAAVSHGYDVMITCDQGISKREDFTTYDITIVTIMNGTWPIIRENVHAIRDGLHTAVRGEPNQVEMNSQA